MRTKDASFYAVSGAKERSAQSSAMGEVQDYAYNATFPILLNISGEPTYIMSHKDKDNLVKRYAMVNVENYQVVVTGTTIAECTDAYVKKLKQNNININVDIDKIEDATNNENTTPETETKKVKGAITDIRTAVMGGESVYFIELDDKGVYYSIKASDNAMVVILNKGETITVTVDADAKGDIIDAISVK